ncbi:hypothetical protein M3665_24605 [Bacillus licheniformis]|nr:hypothetical protein [Bacillus licheniformis]
MGYPFAASDRLPHALQNRVLVDGFGLDRIDELGKVDTRKIDTLQLVGREATAACERDAELRLALLVDELRDQRIETAVALLFLDANAEHALGAAYSGERDHAFRRIVIMDSE